MQMRAEVKPALWGAAGGAIALAIIGFGWGGWVTGASAAQFAKKNADSAVVAILSPICVKQFQAQADAPAKLEELKKISSYQQAGFVEKGGWATMPGSDTPIVGVAAGCATILTTPAS